MTEADEEDFLSARFDPCLSDPLDALKAWCEDEEDEGEAFTIRLDDDEE